MASGQQFLFAPEKPLVKRLGKKFFRQIPRQAGVYKMRDALDNIVYVGKAKDLRQRLGSYRVANPERMAPRHLRLVQSVARIEFELCKNEAAALKHEAKLIRELKPKFNRAGVWQGKPQFLTWRFEEEIIQWAIQETPLTGWERFESLGGYAPRLRAALVRLIWLVMNPGTGFNQMPHGWAQGQFAGLVSIDCGARPAETRAVIREAFWGNQETSMIWLAQTLHADRLSFERVAIAKDLDEIHGFLKIHRTRQKATAQMALL